jgi:glycosyltransferase involved in cell wall biosynthesis
MLDMHKKDYLVSVVITTFNRISLLGRALKSLESQTFKNFEVIVSDDCSDVDVYGYLEEYKINSKLTIRYRRNNENRGACYTRNAGIKMAVGKYIAGLDDDDEFTPTRLEKLLNAYKPEFSFVASNTLVVKKESVKKIFRSKRLIDLNDMLWGNIVGNQILTEKVKLLEIGGFDENLTSSQDADMWLRLIEYFGPALRIKDILYIVHTEHEQQRISTSSNKLKGLKDVYFKHSRLMSESQKSFHEFRISLYSNNRKVNWAVIKKLSVRFFPYLIYKKFFI